VHLFRADKRQCKLVPDVELVAGKPHRSLKRLQRGRIKHCDNVAA